MVAVYESQMRQKQTQAFVDAEPTELPLVRRPWISDGAGGFKRGPATTVWPQHIRLVASNTQLPVRRTVDGRDVQPNYTLIGMPTVDVQSGDTFTIDGVRYEVIFIYPNKTEALRADVGYGR
jgi:hypothetical protein